MAKHVIRVMRGTVKPGNRAKFRAYLTKTVVPRCQADPGLISITIGVPMQDKPDEFTVITVWKDLAALKKFVGPDWRRVHHFSDKQRFLEKESVAHYYARA